MKRTYMKPVMHVTEIQQLCIICASDWDVIGPGQPNQPAGAPGCDFNDWDDDDDEGKKNIIDNEDVIR